MSSKRKGQLSTTDEWVKHLRPTERKILGSVSAKPVKNLLIQN